MNILLIAPPIMDYIEGLLVPISMDSYKQCPPYGVYLLAGILRAKGHDIALADLIADGSNCIKKYHSHVLDAGLIAVSATSLSWPTAVTVIQQIRQIRDDVPIVVGGIHPTMFDKYILQAFPVNFVIRGEGEEAIAILAHAVEQGFGVEQVPNLSWIDKDGAVIRNALAPKISPERLISYPPPAYDLLPTGVYAGISIESSRGCAFDCAFCSTSYRRSYRGFPPSKFVDRLEAVIGYTERTRLGTVHIVDDEFSLKWQRAIDIANEIRNRGLTPLLAYDSRANDLVRDGFVEAIAPFTYRFLIGAECGYDEGLKRIGKGTTCELLCRAAEKLQEYNIADRADFSFILGLPWEPLQDVEKTVRFAFRLHSHYGVRVLLQWYCEIPGSRLWNEDYERGLVSESMYDEFGFFRNLYLFRTGVKLSPKEIYEITDLIEPVIKFTRLAYPEKSMVDYAFPEPIGVHFPRRTLSSDIGLPSLREVSLA